MQHIPIPNGILLRLTPRLTSIFSQSDLTFNSDVQYLFRELAAATKLAVADDDEMETEDLLLVSTLSSTLPVAWDASSTVADNFSSQASSPRAFDSELEDIDYLAPLPPSSPPLYLSDLDINGDDEMTDEMAPRNGPRGVTRTCSALDTGRDVATDRTQRAARREAARGHDEARAAAIQVMGHNWTPDCNRAGDRAPGAGEVVAREMHGGVPMIHGPDGPEPDPSVSEDNLYAPGVGYGSRSGEISGRMDDQEEMEGRGKSKRKGKGNATAKGKTMDRDWKKAVRKARLKMDAAPLMSKLTDVSTIERESQLWAFTEILCGVQPPSPSSSATTTIIAQVINDLETLGMDTRVLNFSSILKNMQLTILVDL